MPKELTEKFNLITDQNLSSQTLNHLNTLKGGYNEIFLSGFNVNFTAYLYIKFQLNCFLRFHETFQWKKFLAFKS